MNKWILIPLALFIFGVWLYLAYDSLVRPLL